MITILTHVLVDPGDPEFQHPDKPVGPIYDVDKARQLAAERRWDMKEVPGNGRRRVVPSPTPKAVLEQNAVEYMIEKGACVIAGGGGGIPLASDESVFHGVEAVVDKDYVAERLATGIGARQLIILTDVPGAALSFASAAPRYLREMTTEEAELHMRRGEFAAGSMLPKVEACVQFIAEGGASAVIAHTSDAAEAFRGRAGTRIVAGNT